jgi:hypothetical protein
VGILYRQTRVEKQSSGVMAIASREETEPDGCRKVRAGLHFLGVQGGCETGEEKYDYGRAGPALTPPAVDHSDTRTVHAIHDQIPHISSFGRQENPSNCRTRINLMDCSSSTIRSPLKSTVTPWSVPVNLKV